MRLWMFRSSAAGRWWGRITDQGGEAVFLACDVAQEDQVRESIEATAVHFGALQAIVNCAGIVHVAPLHAYSEQEWDRLMGGESQVDFLSRSNMGLRICENRNAVIW